MDHKKYDRKEKKAEIHSEKDKGKINLLTKILKEPDSLHVNHHKVPSGLSKRSYDRICELSGISKDLMLKYSLMKPGQQVAKQPKKKKKEFRRVAMNFDLEVLEDLSQEGQCLSKGVVYFQWFMRVMYAFLLVLGFLVFVFLCCHIYQDYFTLELGEFITILLSSFCFLTGGMGLAKLGKRSKAAFDKLSTMLFLQVLCSAFFMAMYYTDILSGNYMAEYIQKNVAYMIVITVVSVVLAFELIICNYVLEDFYVNYYEKEKSKQLLGNEMVEIN